jgi:flavin-dependent dehydrogenase
MVCSDLLEEALDTTMPEHVMSDPSCLGLYYVPPSGRENGGKLRNYSLLNVDRDAFDQWLRDKVEEEGVDVKYNTSFRGFKEKDDIQISLGERVTTKYLIGADGIQSSVREKLYGEEENIAFVFQELVEADGEFDENFYAILREDISPTYGYLIPKKRHLKIGVGVPQPYLESSSQYMIRFKNLLGDKFGYNEHSIKSKEVWGIPYGYVYVGRGNVLLAGDAAGFCNAFSGEGIRLAIESGRAVGYAIEEVMEDHGSLLENYTTETKSLRSLVQRTYSFATNLTDASREEFMTNELKRR